MNTTAKCGALPPRRDGASLPEASRIEPEIGFRMSGLSPTAAIQASDANVRYGREADIQNLIPNVRFPCLATTMSQRGKTTWALNAFLFRTHLHTQIT